MNTSMVFTLLLGNISVTVLFEWSEKCFLHDLFHCRSFLNVDLQGKRKSERQ